MKQTLKWLTAYEFMRCFHQFVPKNCSTIFSQFEKLKKKINFLLFKKMFFSQFANWKINHNKNAFKKFRIPNWWNYLMNSLYVLTGFIEMDVNVFSKSRWVVVANCFCIAERFKNGIGLENLLFNPGMFSRNGSQILQNQFGTFSFSSSRLTRNYHALILSLPKKLK